MRGLFSRRMAIALDFSKAWNRLIGTQGWRSTISCLMPITCMIGKMPVFL